MPIFVIGGQKGGTGKTTVATNLAVALTRARRQVLLVDSDRQRSASKWSNVRDDSDDDLPAITIAERTGKLYKMLLDFKGRYDDVIVDAGGFDSIELRTSLAAADLLYTPIRASQYDLWTLDEMVDVTGQAVEINGALRTFLVLSMAPTNPSVTETADAFALLREYPSFNVCKTVLHDRKAFRDATFQGKGVLELGHAHGGKAALEMTAFVSEVMTHAAIPQVANQPISQAS